MLPEWITKSDIYEPPDKGGSFSRKTIKTIGNVLSKIQAQRGHEKLKHLPAIVKLLGLLVLIVLIAVVRKPVFIMAVTAFLLVYLCLWPAKDILTIFKSAFAASVIATIIFIPAMIINPFGISNNLLVVLKVFLTVSYVNIFNHTTQWNHITGALRKLHIPGVFVFTLDITLKYIVLLGRLITDLLTSLTLRSVGKDSEKYTSVGGVMGVTFVVGSEMNRQMYEAMQCRGFTDDYKGI